MNSELRSIEARVQSVHNMKEIQGTDGVWNQDEYNHGLYNGLEAASAMLDDRDPKFREWEDPK